MPKSRRMTGRMDMNSKEIGEHDVIRAYNDIYLDDKSIYTDYKVCYGEGTFDSGNYRYIGFYLIDIAELSSGTSLDIAKDGNGSILFDSDVIEIIKEGIV